MGVEVALEGVRISDSAVVCIMQDSTPGKTVGNSYEFASEYGTQFEGVAVCVTSRIGPRTVWCCRLPRRRNDGRRAEEGMYGC